MYRVLVSPQLITDFLTKGKSIEGHFKITEGLPQNSKLELIRFRGENNDVELFFSEPLSPGKIRECQITVTKTELVRKK